MPSRSIVTLYVISSLCNPCLAATVSVEAGFDRWMYPFNASAGARPSGSTFGAIGDAQFDDRDAQIIVGFDTAIADVPTGAGVANYQINAARVVLSSATENAFALDPTYDSYSTYLDQTTDADAGRPVELYGVGLRNGYVFADLGTATAGPPAFEETDPFGPPGPPVPANGIRNAYPTDESATAGRDVSNHVREVTEVTPWATGNVSNLAPGQLVPLDAQIEFELDLTKPDVVSYLQSSLDAGSVFFAVTSMHTSIQGSSDGIPSFHLGAVDGASLGQRPQLHLDYAVVPEPTGGVVLGVCIVMATLGSRRWS